MNIQREKLRRAFWPAASLSSSNIWAVFDGARDERIFPMIRDSGLNYACLYSGEIPRELRMVAPHLVELDPKTSICQRLLDLSWGNSWGIFLDVNDAARLRVHLKSFLRVRTEAGKFMLFRYYDPRVMRAYLPTCTVTELRAVFGPIGRYLMESEDGSEMLAFSFDGKEMSLNRMGLGEDA